MARLDGMGNFVLFVCLSNTWVHTYIHTAWTFFLLVLGLFFFFFRLLEMIMGGFGLWELQFSGLFFVTNYYYMYHDWYAWEGRDMDRITGGRR